MSRRFEDKALAEQVRGMLTEDRLEEYSCPCGSVEYKVLATEDRFGLPVRTVICRDCGLVRQNPRLNASSLKKFYECFYRELESAHSTHDLERLLGNDFESGLRRVEKQFAYLRDVLAKRNDPIEGKTIVDIGCGTGGAVRYLGDAGFSIQGYDLDPAAVEFGLKKGLPLHRMNILELRLPRAADLMILSHIVEHVGRPEKFFFRLRENLKPGGYLFIEVPGIHTIGFHRFDCRLIQYLTLSHVYSFSLATLRRVVEPEGFRFISGNEIVMAVFQKTDEPLTVDPQLDQFRRIMVSLRGLSVKCAMYRFFEQIHLLNPVKKIILLVLRLRDRLMPQQKTIAY